MLLRLPDGVDVEVPIEHMAVKDSVFVPTLKVDDTRTLVHRVAREIQIKISAKTAVVDGYLGLLFYRIQ